MGSLKLTAGKGSEHRIPPLELTELCHKFIIIPRFQQFKGQMTILNNFGDFIKKDPRQCLILVDTD